VEHIVHCAIDIERLAHIVADKLKVGASHQVLQVFLASCDEVVYDDHLPAFGNQAIDKVRADEARASRNDSSRHQRCTSL
jgi:hypothetical protein